MIVNTRLRPGLLTSTAAGSSQTKRFQRVLIQSPDDLYSHLYLAVIYSEVGQEEEARTEAAEGLKINPYFSLEGMRQRDPVKDQEGFERHLAGLRKAGLLSSVKSIPTLSFPRAPGASMLLLLRVKRARFFFLALLPPQPTQALHCPQLH